MGQFKRKMKENIKIWSVLLLTFFVFYACDDELDEPAIVQQNSPIVQVKDKLDNPKVINLLKDRKEKINRGFSKYLSKTKASRSNDSIKLEGIEINTEIFSVIESENGKASYTFEVDLPEGTVEHGIVNLHVYYDENDELKTALIGYNLTEEEMQMAQENQSFDGFMDKIYHTELENFDFLNNQTQNEQSTSSRTNTRTGGTSTHPCFDGYSYHGNCGGVFGSVWRALTGVFSTLGDFFSSSGSSTGIDYSSYGNGYAYSGLGGNYTGGPSVVTGSLLRDPNVASSLQRAGVFIGINYSNLTTVPYSGSINYSYTTPVQYYSVNNVTIPARNSSSSPTPLSSYYSYYFGSRLKNIITTYYNYPSSRVIKSEHDKKQAIINDFMRFTYSLDHQTLRYLGGNQSLMLESFLFLALNHQGHYYASGYSQAREFVKQQIALEKILDGEFQVRQTGEMPLEISNCCPGSCCPDPSIYGNDKIIQEYGIEPVQSAVDGTFNLISSSISLIASDRWVGERVRRIMIEIGVPVPSDVTDEHLAAIFRIRKRNGIVLVEYREGILRSMLDFGLNTLDMISFLTPSKGGGAFLATKMGGRITITKMTEHLRKISINNTKIDDLISDLRNNSPLYSLNGTGKYRDVGGHHPLAKKAFELDKFYKFREAFSVSTSKLQEVWRNANPDADLINVHSKITGQQNSLYSAFKRTGEVLTIQKMAEIEIKAMVNVNIPESIATGWVIKALGDLKAQGVKGITHIPWGGIN